MTTPTPLSLVPPLPDRVFRFLFKNTSGDLVEAIVAEPGSLFVRTYDGQYATFFDSPGGPLRPFLQRCNPDYIDGRFRARVPGHKLTSHAAKSLTIDVLRFWQAFRDELEKSLAEDP